jgi:hypothetical protein
MLALILVSLLMQTLLAKAGRSRWFANLLPPIGNDPVNSGAQPKEDRAHGSASMRHFRTAASRTVHTGMRPKK